MWQVCKAQCRAISQRVTVLCLWQDDCRRPIFVTEAPRQLSYIDSQCMYNSLLLKSPIGQTLKSSYPSPSTL